jgi:RimJ/RimL family protein N-acetyltransferase
MQEFGRLGPRILQGRFVALEPFSDEHRELLRDAAADSELWRYMPVDGSGEGFDAWWNAALSETAAGTRIAFAVRRLADGAIVGSTSYLAIVPLHARVEIGSTWYVAAAQGTAVNPEAKLLLFANAFEVCRFERVELKCDARNTRSRAAIQKLGAKEEGVLRSHMWVHAGYRRDTVYYSLLRDEWPFAKSLLLARSGGSWLTN